MASRSAQAERAAAAGRARSVRPAVRVPPGTGFWFTATAFAVLMAFGTAPTPLWPLYEARDGFGATTVTVAYAVLVIGAAFGFAALGHLSDRLGRRRVVVAALAVAIVAALVLAFWTGLGGLLAGRVLNGVGIGLMASTATTYLYDLHRRAHPDRPVSAVPGVVATMANLGGLALGPLAAGIVAQWAPHPLPATQLGFAAAMAVCLVLALCTPETVDRGRRSADRPARFALRPGAAKVFAAACGLGFFSFALLGLVSSLGAIILHTDLGIGSHFLAGLAPALMFAAAAVGQLLIGRLRPVPTAVVGAVVFPVGLALVVVATRDPRLWLFLVAVAVAGAGAGVLFKGGVMEAGAAAQPRSRAGVLAVYFIAGYVGLGGPSILFSVITDHASLDPVMLGFAVLLSLGAAVSAAAIARYHPEA
ncbi:MFS transporter [Actinacidiphila guanduensis]|uniref:Predicted arabinose efflux permease, MFS family n=1 Tax=Actinacidiphila guanduensis TaxID=310781 RepID=A0A1H0C5R6_9ACTN|nr:MFS transporter [Actinacidiphila guanduensis]SDN53206.1 Predicted arabinose efflux permease, MFS family [Actinacidiphila guanduensis]